MKTVKWPTAQTTTETTVTRKCLDTRSYLTWLIQPIKAYVLSYTKNNLEKRLNLPPGCVAPNDISICSMVGCT